MSKVEKEKIMLSEHVLEVRHAALGTFLDVRGYVADYIRQSGYFPHWQIDANVVNFRDEPNTIKTEGAFVGYKSAGYVTLNPFTRNYFADRASSFWHLLLKNSRYKIPEPTRFGIRTKLFIPSPQSFDEINKAMFEGLFTEKARSIVGGKETDLQFIIESKEDVFDVRVSGGPIHKDEAKKHFQFDADQFNQCGLFLDIDYFKTDGLSLSKVPNLLKTAINLTWKKAEKIASGVGL
ncbi:hypothetical protein LCGC14_1707410 [marine sediment metagenome]|uniref:TIGR04255 family protein n=1 Tax=marine sediment metagenome TaxID=412755 RepID=A0A0F9KGA1_9ZZZZ